VPKLGVRSDVPAAFGIGQCRSRLATEFDHRA